MKKIILITLVTLLVILGVSSSQILADNKVKICHSTSSTSNPYVKENPDKSGDVGGHDIHNGGVYPANPWGDIIPPFEYGDDENYPGKNWTTEGEVIWNNNCNIPSTSPSPSPSVSPSPSPSPSTSPTPKVEYGLTAGSPDCSNSFHAEFKVKVGGVGQKDIMVKFSYKAEEKTAITNSDGIAGVDFEFKGNGDVTAKSEGYENQTIGVQAKENCAEGGSTPEVLGASTTSGQVLGVSTFAETGVFDESLMTLLFTLGSGLIGLGVKTYAKKN